MDKEVRFHSATFQETDGLAVVEFYPSNRKVVEVKPSQFVAFQKHQNVTAVKFKRSLKMRNQSN